MISRLRLSNFQSHRDTTIEFANGFNLIVGPSDNGKSAIIRALEWVRSNRPRGASFISYDADAAEVTVTVDEHLHVTRSRGVDSTGTYSIKRDGDVENLSYMGNEVPEQVRELLGMDSVNVQLQLDGHFLILDAPGQAAAAINNVTKLDKIGTGISTLKNRKAGLVKQLASCKEQLTTSERFLSSGVVEKLERLKELRDSAQSISDRVTELSDREREVKQLTDELRKLKDSRKVMVDVDAAESMIGRVDGIVARIDEIHSLLSLVRQGTEYDKTRESVSVDIIQAQAQLDEVTSQVKECPYCGLKLTAVAKSMLLEGKK